MPMETRSYNLQPAINSSFYFFSFQEEQSCDSQGSPPSIVAPVLVLLRLLRLLHKVPDTKIS